jgi:hypothetical protein
MGQSISKSNSLTISKHFSFFMTNICCLKNMIFEIFSILKIMKFLLKSPRYYSSSSAHVWVLISARDYFTIQIQIWLKPKTHSKNSQGFDAKSLIPAGAGILPWQQV